MNLKNKSKKQIKRNSKKYKSNFKITKITN